jgi:hypothetical protein
MQTPTMQSVQSQPRASALLVLVAIAAVFVGIAVPLRNSQPQSRVAIPPTRIDPIRQDAEERQMEWVERQNLLTYTNPTPITRPDITTLEHQIEWLERFNALTYTPAIASPASVMTALDQQVEWLEWYSSLAYCNDRR